jgi:hypothetical protein
MEETDISPLTWDECLLTQLVLNPKVILSQGRRICAQVERWDGLQRLGSFVHQSAFIERGLNDKVQVFALF